ncbi:zinc metallochaperone AztD [Brevibacterium luteolum]|uniref:zinc metallochaperone AztD n=2 Tax=Brevibacterium luteolum TaxID=199591 RepID=UPI00223B2E63|nr:zinc metallochaperone AztD [Brevibacterium luteolum]MCT1889929.1 hypothetical protein [Brevibacterium luteolum]MCT1892331.1 hypothetical protein [Brevibacterium luteolum]MCT1923592.1 hypothetical protein [Brevibacterium luteolum]
MTLHIPRIPSLLTASAAALSLAVLTGCGSTISDSARQPPEPTERQTAEAAGPAERIALTYDGGVMVLDAESHEVLGNFEAEGFTRLNAAGDNRHLFLTEGDSFRLLDMGTWSEPHGDHSHSYTTDPLLTDQRIEGSHPGHLINHDGTSVAFFDGTGEIHSFDPAELSADAPIKTEKTQAKEAHHGVAVVRTDGSMIHTVGNEDTRSGVVIRDADGTDIAGNSDCPGVHGEAAVKDGVITVGCENGLLIITDDEITKVDSPDEHGRIGNQRGHEDSPVVLGDYKTDPEAEVERPTRVTLTDTTSGKLTLVDLPAAYSFRSLGRGAEGEALVHGTDGTLRVIDPESGTIGTEIPVTGEWEEPKDWQQPQPTVHVSGEHVYVTEPAEKKLHVVDLAAGKVTASIDLPEVPGEIATASGDVAAGAEEHEHDHEPGREDGHDHDHDHDQEHDHEDDGNH